MRKKLTCVVPKRARHACQTGLIRHQFKVDPIVSKKPAEPFVEGA